MGTAHGWDTNLIWAFHFQCDVRPEEPEGA